ncbi:MAG: nucleotidyltransferase domain-containing protein [Nanoarchaeota archaeon]|nr:nucleotidyltransferase domain-containing protein [Nanoarchaeota archaeon]
MDKNENLDIAKKFKKALLNGLSLKKLILFGSRARGDFGKDSDFDFIVVSDEFDEGKRLGRMGKVYKYWNVDYSVDFVCLTSGEFERVRENRQTVIGLAVEEGVEI